MARVISFKVPKGAKRPPKEAFASDRSSTWELLQKLHPDANLSMPPASAVAQKALERFERSQDSLLVPPKHLPLPFAQHSTINGDKSYITQPRLSVTKLLTESWCELREYYKVFAGLPAEPRTKRLKEGSEYHGKIEALTHKTANTELVADQITHLTGDDQDLVKNPKAADMGREWTERVVVRILSVARRSGAREILVHGFLDFKSASLVSSPDGLHLGVLVNGIADIVQLEDCEREEERLKLVKDAGEESADTTGDSSLHDIGLMVIESPENVLPSVSDLSILIPKAKKEAEMKAKTHSLHVGDVKTRRVDSIPAQASVVDSARIQCMYYAYFLCNLAQDSNFAYASIMENAKRRQVDPHAAIGIAHVNNILLSNFGVLVKDFLRLAKGDKIGFAPFDDSLPESAPMYSLSQLASEVEFREMLTIVSGKVPEFSEVDISALFSPWQRPLTFSYFAARAAQAYNVLEHFQPTTVGVEYHNSRTGQIIESRRYEFDQSDFDTQMERACLFWDGTREPEATDDVGKCRYCNFQSRCPAINVPKQESIGGLIYDNLLK